MKNFNKSYMICVLALRLARPTPAARATAPPACLGGPAYTPEAPDSRATCVYVSWPVELYNSGIASRGLLAAHGAGIMNSSPWVGHGREVGSWWGSTKAGTPCMHNSQQ